MLGACPTTLLEWDSEMAWTSAFTKPGTAGAFAAKPELRKSALLSLQQKERKYDVITDSDYTADLAASMTAYKIGIIITPYLQRLQKQNKDDTKPTHIPQIKLFSLYRFPRLT